MNTTVMFSYQKFTVINSNIISIIAVDEGNVMAVGGGEVCRKCVRVCVRHRMGDSSQGWLRLNLRPSVSVGVCLPPSLPVLCYKRM